MGPTSTKDYRVFKYNTYQNKNSNFGKFTSVSKFEKRKKKLLPKYFLIPKVKNIYYNYHASNFLAGLIQNQKNLNLKYTYFYTKFLYSIAKSLENLGLIAGVKIAFDNQYYSKADSHPDIKKNKLFFFHLFHYKTFLKNVREEIIYRLKNYNLERPLMHIYLKYSGEKPLIHSLRIYSSPGRRLHISKFKLSKLVYSNAGSTIFLSSSHGILDHSKALSLGIGGILLYKIN